ncbi:MAG: Glu/Leu/Phe/Val dehydrogenase family protein, partial [Thermoanaerobaculia bacterium]|nr:Glu/Leu/Phe/Val dehydrogenase family protein [Thermoanaerobaculia bacterium]
AAAQHRWGTDSLAGRAVAIQGLGSVGSYLAGYLAEEGAKVFGCDIDAESCARASDRHGVEIVPPHEIFDVEADVFSPCALGAILHPESIARLRVSIVAGGANNQLAEPARDGDELDRRGILYAPDFVINAGGLINVYAELNGYDRRRAMRLAGRIYGTTLELFELARREKVPTWVAGDRLAERRIAQVKSVGPRHWELAARQRLGFAN